MTRPIHSFLLMPALALQLGCAIPELQARRPQPVTPPPAAAPLTVGTLATDGITIEAEDGSFKIVAGETFSTPFSADCWSEPAQQHLAGTKGTVVEGYSYALSRGAKRVQVTAPGIDKPLNGVLLFNFVPDTATGPASRSYYIQVPDDRLQSAQGGQISVTFEKVFHTLPGGEKRWWYSWVLWLSDGPLPEKHVAASLQEPEPTPALWGLAGSR